MEAPVILFDGVCNLCQWSVRLIIRSDRRGRLRFAAQQSEAGQALLAAHAARPELADSVALVEGGQVYAESTAALRIARLMDWPWPVLAALLAVPRPIRDAAYRLVARNRYRWFGRQDACMAPTPALRERFL